MTKRKAAPTAAEAAIATAWADYLATQAAAWATFDAVVYPAEVAREAALAAAWDVYRAAKAAAEAQA